MNLRKEFLNGVFDPNFGDGSYKVLINGNHVLTKRIKDGKGENYAGGLKIPYLDFKVVPSMDEGTIDFVYETFVDHVRKVNDGLQKDDKKDNHYVGYLECNGRNFFWFELIKE